MNTPPSPPGVERTEGSSVQIGALVPLTRPGWVEAGRHLLAGLELAVREVNDAGGIVGRPLELVVRDTAADPQRAAAAVDELARLGVAALAGEYHSVVARAAAARADALGLPFLCSSAVLDALIEQPTEWVARLAPAQSRGWQIYADFLLSAGYSRIAVAAESSVYWASGARILRNYLAPRGGTVIELDMRALGPTAVCDELAGNRSTALLLLVGHPEPGSVDRQVCPPRPAPRRDHDWCSGRATGVRRMGDVAGRRQRRDPVLALPARAPQPTRCTSQYGPPRAASRSALLRRLRGLRHGRRPRRCAAFSPREPSAHCRILAARCSRRHPRADPVLPHARHQRLAMGLGANPSR
jgi:hypothetical protein